MQEALSALPLFVFPFGHFSQPHLKHEERISFCVAIKLRLRHGKLDGPFDLREIDKGSTKGNKMKQIMITVSAALACVLTTMADSQEVATKMATVCGFTFGSELKKDVTKQLEKPFRFFKTVDLSECDGRLREMKFMYVVPTAMDSDAVEAEMKAIKDIFEKKYGMKFEKDGFYDYKYYENYGSNCSVEITTSPGWSGYIALEIKNIYIWKKAAKADVKTLNADEGANVL